MSAPTWPYCARGADPTSDPVGCRGRQVEPYGACLAHLTNADRATYLSALAPGSDLDHRSTSISQSLLQQLLDALRDPTTGQPRLGNVRFGGATFSDGAGFDEVTFSGDTVFSGATFSADARFDESMFSGYAAFSGATFSADARFDRATFAGDTVFSGATFSDGAGFDEVTFSGYAGFDEVTFSADARFNRATFSGVAGFDEATFSARARFGGAMFCARAGFDRAMFSARAGFDGATFETASQLGPLVCKGALGLSGARFGSPVTVEAAATRLECRRTRWDSTAALRLRYATVDLSDAVFEYPLSVTARTAPFTDTAGTALAEEDLVSSDPRVRMASLRGADAAHLVLHDVDLSACLLSGTVHLDQLRLEGECRLAPAPSGLRRHGVLLARWTARQTLAEEQHWRAARRRSGWTAAPAGLEVVGPAGLAPVYRQLRKSFEDSKNEPDAADFYYGEMEMRRHDHQRPGAERALLALYWAMSGYGLRASRALGWLLGSMAATVLVMMLWGLPADDPKPATTGRVTGQDISLTTDRPDPLNPTGSLSSRLTSDRWEKSLRIVVNSVVFRSSGRDLTTVGTYTEMASRLAEPVLLGLAVLAVRGRVKR
ncbi:pentapeptide repeat-containing protein [Streptomyces sp. NBC_01794]|uniref:pentapeptide repeat-containing protein n=1 Tax=Streptomyces sp. NBC_01794 TaxID=2975942 RepID=UPI00308E167F|nr:pentapeptide repeat-containing protein [Streptomyces sp. NBC_01794]